MPTKIGIAGAGGIGSWLVYFLYEFGVKRKQFDIVDTEIDIFDDDVIDVKNLLHQNFSEKELGKHKAKVLEERYGIVTPKTKFMEKKDFKNYDVIFSCVDGMEFRKTLYNYGYDHPELFWIDGRAQSRQAYVFNSDIPKVSLEKFIDDSKERAGCLLAYEKEHNISHSTPITVASAMTQIYLNHLRGEKITRERMLIL